MIRFNIVILFILSVLASHARIYVIGNGEGMSDDPVHPMVLDPVMDKYSFSIINGDSFMISTSMGSSLEFNAYGLGTTISAQEVGVVLALVPKHSPTTLPWTGDWNICISSDLLTIVAESITTPPEEQPRLFIRGDMNSWEADEKWEFFTTDDGETFWFDAQGPTAISSFHEFKIGDLNWNNYILGPAGGSAIVCDGEPRLWVEYGQDAKVPSDYTGSIKVVLTDDGEHNAYVTFFPFLIDHSGITDPNATAENEQAQFFDLSGIPVTKPEKGKIYIRRTDMRATKIIIP